MEYRGLPLVEWNGKFYFELKEYGPPPDRQGRILLTEKFERKYNLRDKRKLYAPYSLNRLLTGRITHQDELSIGGFWDYRHSIFDHIQLFYSPVYHVYVLTGQPYSLDIETSKEFEVFCAEYGLYVHISYDDAWHFPGSAPLIAVTKAKDIFTPPNTMEQSE